MASRSKKVRALPSEALEGDEIIYVVKPDGGDRRTTAQEIADLGPGAASEIDNDSDVSGASVADALNALASAIAGLGAGEVPQVHTAAGDCTLDPETTLLIIAKTVAAPTTVNLGPAADKIGSVRIIDGNGDAGTHAITLTPDGAELINGAASWSIQNNDGSTILTPITTGTNRWNAA